MFNQSHFFKTNWAYGEAYIRIGIIYAVDNIQKTMPLIKWSGQNSWINHEIHLFGKLQSSFCQIKSFYWCKIQILNCYPDKHNNIYQQTSIKFKQHSFSIRLYLDVLKEVIRLQIFKYKYNIGNAIVIKYNTTMYLFPC